jgi:hypothetical protein
MVFGGPRERESNPRRPVLVARNRSSIVIVLELDLVSARTSIQQVSAYGFQPWVETRAELYSPFGTNR